MRRVGYDETRFGHAGLAVVIACALAFVVGLPWSMQPCSAWADEEDGTWNSSADETGSPSDDDQTSVDTTMSDVRDVPISDLENADELLDDQIVQITGEVIGDRIYAEGDESHCWLVIEARDSSYAEISVYVDVDATKLIDTYGNYGNTGTIVEIYGTFNIACSEHEGLSDLHAEGLSVVSEGSHQSETLNLQAFLPAVVLIVVGLVLLLIFHRLRESKR